MGKGKAIQKDTASVVGRSGEESVEWIESDLPVFGEAPLKAAMEKSAFGLSEKEKAKMTVIVVPVPWPKKESKKESKEESKESKESKASELEAKEKEEAHLREKKELEDEKARLGEDRKKVDEEKAEIARLKASMEAQSLEWMRKMAMVGEKELELAGRAEKMVKEEGELEARKMAQWVKEEELKAGESLVKASCEQLKKEREVLYSLEHEARKAKDASDAFRVALEVADGPRQAEMMWLHERVGQLELERAVGNWEAAPTSQTEVGGLPSMDAENAEYWMAENRALAQSLREEPWMAGTA